MAAQLEVPEAWLKRLIHGINRTTALIAGVGIIAMILITSWDVLMRYFLDKPSGWVFEVDEYLIVFSAYLAMAYCMQVRGHIAVDTLYNLYPARGKSVADFVVAILSLFVWGILAWESLQQSLYYLERNVKSSTMLAVPQVYPMLLITVGSLICCFQALLMIYDGASALRSKDSGKNAGKE